MSPQALGTVRTMSLATPVTGRRQQLLLLAVVVALTLSLLAMHQLSVNHTAAQPTTQTAAAIVGSPERHDHQVDQLQHSGDLPGHAAQPVPGQQQTTGVGDGCAGCPEHHVMALTCLAALILLALGWALRPPTAWRGVLLPRLPTAPRPLSPRWGREPLSLLELSVSRT